MLKLFFFSTLLYDRGSIVRTLTYGDKGVCTDDVGNLSCCFDHTLFDGKCVGCTIGFSFKGGSCMPCKTNQYGSLCLRKCSCAFHQRCDNVHGCVNKSTLTETTSSQSTTCKTENFKQTTTNLSEESEITNPTSSKKSSNEDLKQTTRTKHLSEESEITKPTPTRKSSDGLLDREIVIYSIVVACIIVILGLSYLVQKYRKKTKKKPRHITVQVTHSNGHDSLVDPNLSIYDEIDETMLVENASINVLQNEISLNTDNTSYLYPIHLEDDKRSSSVSAKSVNNSYLSIHESDPNRTSDESDKNDDATSYLHPYHMVDEDSKEKTHQYNITHVSDKDTDDSSDSSTHMINDGYLHPYQPLNDDWKQTSHSYEVPVTVHNCQRHSAVTSLSDEELKENGNGDYQKTSIKHNKVGHIREAVLSTCNTQEMADGISLNDEMKEISASIGMNLRISKELKNTKHISTSNPPSTQKENAKVPVVESDIKVFDKNEDNLHNYNLLKNVTIQTVSSIHTDQNTNLHDYTDAKSQ